MRRYSDMHWMAFKMEYRNGHDIPISRWGNCLFSKRGVPHNLRNFELRTRFYDFSMVCRSFEYVMGYACFLSVF
jgi:hypothetical protein